MPLVVVTYVFPKNGEGEFLDLALKFIASYKRYPAGAPHQMLVVCNGHKITDEAEALFGEIPGCAFMEWDNSGLDCGAYQAAAREIPGDLMVFFGANAYIRGPGWLSRMVESWNRHGDTLYGSTANRGDRHGVWPHIRTTGFWISSSLFNSYPIRVKGNGRFGDRYQFEHGPKGLTSWVKSRGLIPWLVYWDGEYEEHNWDGVSGGFHNGDQRNLICGDRMSAPPYHSCP